MASNSTSIAPNMRKEVIVSIVLGVSFGIIIAFGVWRANSALNDKDGGGESETAVETINASPTPGSSQITIRSLQNNEVVTENPVRISGNTVSDARVVVSTEDDDYIMISNGNGDFDADVELVGGVNQIRIFVFSDEGRLEKSIDLVYSSEFENVKENGDTEEETVDE